MNGGGICSSDRYMIYLYCLAVQASFFSLVVECRTLSLADWVQFQVAALGFFHLLQHDKFLYAGLAYIEVKLKIYRSVRKIFFLISPQNICCGYSLEVPWFISPQKHMLLVLI